MDGFASLAGHGPSHPVRRLLGAEALAVTPEPDALADIKLFATAWLGGIVFFGTYLS